jgi:hypothetical protein
MHAVLQVLTGTLQNRVLLLPSPGGAPYVLGRSLEANLILPGHLVAERHALLIPVPQGHRLVPASTTKPVWLGEHHLRSPRTLRDGDQIRIGKHTLLYQQGSTRTAIAVATAPCSSCGQPLGPRSGREGSLEALSLGDALVCPRCVDARLRLNRQLSSYRILRKITNNDQEVTYLAVDTRSLNRVAVRILRTEREAVPQVLRSFLVRALAGVALDHPNFVPTCGVDVSEGIPFVVVEHVEKSTKLEVLVREQSPAPAVHCVYVTNQLAEILRYARERQLVVAKRRRTGVLIDPEGWVKVLAYGVTFELERRVCATLAFEELAQRVGADPTLLRSAPYPTDPDKARLGTIADEFAEVYSVGRILYQMMVGRPFAAGSIEMVKTSAASARKRGRVRGGALDGRARPLVDLLERVIVPRGEERIRTLEAFTAASKATFETLLADGSLRDEIA